MSRNEEALKKRESTIVKTSLIGILANILLVVGKAIVGFIAGSISIVMDAVNNLTDALSSTITIIGTKLSSKRPDKKHPFGHGRIEYLTSTIIGALILFAGGAAIFESVKDIVGYYQGGSLPSYDNLALILISVAILVKVGLGFFFRAMGKKTDSESLKASGLDALWDSLLSLSTLIGAIISRFAGFYIEGYLGILIGLFILKSGIGVIRESISSIIGDRDDTGMATAIKKIAVSHPEVKGVYDVILNKYGPHKTIGSFHIELEDSVSAKQIHGLCRIIEAEIYTQLHIITTIGVYAKNESDPESIAIKTKLREILKDYPTLLQMHGFYVNQDKKMVTYDLIFDFQESKMEENAAEICKKMQEAFPEYSFYPILDQDYSD